MKNNTPPPPRLYHSVGMNLCVRPRVNGNSKSCFGIRPIAFAKKWPQKLEIGFEQMERDETLHFRYRKLPLYKPPLLSPSSPSYLRPPVVSPHPPPHYCLQYNKFNLL